MGARWWLAILVGCSQPATRPPASGSGQPRPLITFARVEHPITFVQGRDRLALEFDSVWITFDVNGRHDDTAVATSLEVNAQAIGGGDAVALFWGRTPLVANASPAKAAVARAGGPPLSTPGFVFEVVALGDEEVWRFTDDTMAIVDRHDAIVRQPAPAHIGKLACDPQVLDLAASPSGVAALIVECDPDADVRVQDVLGSGAKRRLHTLAPVQPSLFLVAADRSPIVVGRRYDVLALARGARDGSWNVTTTAIPAGSIQFAVLASDGAVWAITTSTGSNGKDSYQLTRDGVAISVMTADGVAISPRQLGVDSSLGIVVVGRAGEMQWIAAEQPPAGVAVLP